MSLLEKISEKNEENLMDEETQSKIDKAVKKAKYYDKIGIEAQNGL